MRRELWIGLWALSVCGAFATGMVVHRPKAPPALHRKAGGKSQSRRSAVGAEKEWLARTGTVRKTIAEKEQRIGELEAEIAEVLAEAPPALSPEDEKEWQDSLAWKRKWARQKALDEKGKALRRKILQRRDQALREEGLTELATLIGSENDNDLALGLRVLSRLREYDFDREKFCDGVRAALDHGDPFIRRMALECTRKTLPWEEIRGIAIRMANDPSDDVRWWIAPYLGFCSWSERKEEAAPLVRAYLQDENYMIRWRMLEHLHSFSGEVDDLYIKLLDDPHGLEGALTYSLGDWQRKIVSPGIVQRLAEKFEEGYSERALMRFLGSRSIDLEHPPSEDRRWQGSPRLAPEARPILSNLYLRMVRDGLVNRYRREALDCLRKMGDPWILPELDAISRSSDAEGIEEQVAKTIEYLQKMR